MSTVTVPTFRKATKERSFLRQAIAGPSGSGKTYTALAIAAHLSDSAVAVVDTEHGSASKYADIFDFDVIELGPPFHPDRFVECINVAAGAGFGVLVLDSLSHAWNGTGGLLEIVDQIAARDRSANSFTAWKGATPIQNRLVEAIISAPLHIIATMRSKTEYVIEQVERNGKTRSEPRKVGMAPVQRDSFEYEFDVFGEMDQEHRLIITKTRCTEITDAVIMKPGVELAHTLRAWLGRGVEPRERPTVAVPAPSSAPEESPVPAPPQVPAPQRAEPAAFSLDDKVGFGIHRSETWRGLLETEAGIDYVRWAVRDAKKLTDEGRGALAAALPAQATEPDPTAAQLSVELTEALENARVLGFMSPEQDKRCQEALASMDEGDLQRTLDWLATRTEANKLQPVRQPVGVGNSSDLFDQ